MGQIVVYALLSAVCPPLIAATTVMLLLPRGGAPDAGLLARGDDHERHLRAGDRLRARRHEHHQDGARHRDPVLDLVIAVLLALYEAKAEPRRRRWPHLTVLPWP